MSNSEKTELKTAARKPRRRTVKKKPLVPLEYFVYTTLGVLLVVGCVAGAGIVLARRDAAMLSARMRTLEETVFATGGVVQQIAGTVSDESERSDEYEAALEEKLAVLYQNITAQESKIQEIEMSETGVSDIAREWDAFVYRLGCFFKIDDDDVREDRGSATAERTPNGVRILTSKHIIERKGAVFEGCELTRSGSDISVRVEPSAFIKNETQDFAYAYLPEEISAVPFDRRCTTAPNIGDAVLILGYPGIGAKESVTVTDGIISGFDAEHYTTSAKIEKGNSGGAAVDVRRNCFLGLPALVLPGNVESLARILPVLSL